MTDAAPGADRSAWAVTPALHRSASRPIDPDAVFAGTLNHRRTAVVPGGGRRARNAPQGGCRAALLQAQEATTVARTSQQRRLDAPYLLADPDVRALLDVENSQRGRKIVHSRVATPSHR